MSTNKFRERLDARKKKITTLVKGIAEHEQERDEVMSQRTKFTDGKYATSKSSFSMYESPESEMGKTSSSPPESIISKMMKTPSEAKQRKSKKKSASPGPKGKGKITSKPIKATKSFPGPSAATKKSKSPKRAKETVINMPDGRGDLKPPKIAPRRSLTKPLNAEGRLVDPDASKSIIKPGERISDLFKEGNTPVKTDDDETSEEDEEEGFLHIIEALHCFEKAKYVFMQRLLDYVEIEAAGVSFHSDAVDLAYQVLNVEGQLLFLMQQQKIKCTGFIVYSKKSFENILYDVYGNKVLKYIGPRVFMSKMISRMTVTDGHDRTLGYIKAFGSKVNYSIYNAIGERGHKIGTIRYGWKHTLHNLNYIDYETSGIEIPPELDEREKALLLGCLMLIEFFWYSPLTRLKLSMLFGGLFLLVIAILILITPLLIDNPKVDPQTKSYYLAEKLDPPKEKEAPGI